MVIRRDNYTLMDFPTYMLFNFFHDGIFTAKQIRDELIKRAIYA